MAQISLVDFSQLRRGKRIDADRYLPKYLVLEDKLSSLKNAIPLSHLLSEPVTTGHTPIDRELLPERQKIHFIKTDTLREGQIVFDNADFLPSTSLSIRDYLKDHDILVTIIGATHEIIGRSAIFLKSNPNSAINQNIAIIRADENKIDPFFLTVFLNSKYGREQLWMLSRQTEQVNLNCREVEDLVVPVLSDKFQKQIKSLFRKSIGLIQNSKELFFEAEKTLLKDLALEHFETVYPPSYASNFSEIVKAKRIDAEYYKPIYFEIIKRIKKGANGNLKLLDCVEPIPDDFRPAENPDEQFCYVELADIEPSIGVIGNCSQIFGSEAPSRAQRRLKAKDILISNVEGSLKQVALVAEEFDKALASTGFFQFRANKGKIEPEVFLVIAMSPVLQLQLKRESTGTILSSVPSHALDRIIIPILKEGTNEKIKKLVKESHADWQEGKRLFADAKKAIESAIDQSEGRFP